MYRLAADVFNDTAMIFDCLSPALPKALRVTLLSFSSVLRALCGVAAGSSKASLSAHFAKWGNLGELNAVSPLILFLGGWLGIGGESRILLDFTAVIFVEPWLRLTELYNVHSTQDILTVKQKDSSQETIISLMGYVLHKVVAYYLMPKS